MIKQILLKAKNLIFFWQKPSEPEMPYERAEIVYNELALANGIKDDINKEIVIFNGDEIVKVMPYSKSRITILKEEEHIPVFDSTKEERFIEGIEINPMEIKYEQ